MRPLLALALACGLTAKAGAVEPWSDDQMPVRAGLQLWFDCSRQNAGRSAADLPPSPGGSEVDFLLDGSGHRRNLSQPAHDARPHFRQDFDGAYVSFDGIKGSLSATGMGQTFSNVTVFLIGESRTNNGGFNAFFSLNQAGKNDYTSGLCLDLGPERSDNIFFINSEGAGTEGAQNLIDPPALQFGDWHLYRLQTTPGAEGTRLFIDGNRGRSRPRANEPMRMDDFALSARHYSNSQEPPFLQGFLPGAIAEFLLYDRILSAEETTAVEKYLNRKYGQLMAHSPLTGLGAKALLTVSNPPPVQAFVPGFVVRPLPVHLPNINDIKYRPDGKLVALGYNGMIYLLSDPDHTGLESQVDYFWTNNTMRAPIGMCLTPPGYPRGEGVFVASKGKFSLIVDTNGDGHADQEIVIAQGWQELSHGVDALGAAMDRDGNLYFGLGTASFVNPYLIDQGTGQSHYDLNSERGTILKVSPDFKHREVLCTGIRFSVAMAVNGRGDLFCTDQEGATWLPNGNPLDELLWLRPGLHYGFPPRHPKYLTNVVDEPSLFDYAPQHQSTCGLNFDLPVNGGPVFGPAWWRDDAIVSGYSRGKIWRTELVKTSGGYVAANHLIGSLTALTVDSCVSPAGDLVISTHSGDPDWGTGPGGMGALYKLTYLDTNAAQPCLTWSASPTELCVAFDRPVPTDKLRNLKSRLDMTQGRYVSAGDRFEVKRPSYAAVFNQLSEPRYDVAILDTAISADQRVLTITTAPREAGVNYSITLSNWNDGAPTLPGAIPQAPDMDLATDLSGVMAFWTGKNGASWQGWLPHLDLEVSQGLTAQSSEHQRFWPKLNEPGTLVLNGQLNLWEMLQPAIQPGAKLDYERPTEQVTVTFRASAPFELVFDKAQTQSHPASDGVFEAEVKHPGQMPWIPFHLTAPTGPDGLKLTASWTTDEAPRPRPFFVRRFLLPWAKLGAEPAISGSQKAIPELAGGNWLRGRAIFYASKVDCERCHTIRGQGHLVGPDLSNLVFRDYASVLRDIREPSAVLNPDHLAYNITLTDDSELTAVVLSESPDHIKIALVGGAPQTIERSRIKKMVASKVSLMPEGLDKALQPEEMRDLMTFLLTQPIEPTPISIVGEPPARSLAEVAAPWNAVTNLASATPFQILLCAGPKDHGINEHDYPEWQKRWESLLAMQPGVTVATAWEWPTQKQFASADAVVFYSNNPGWGAAHAADLEAFLARGKGAVFVHFAVDGHNDWQSLANFTGLAWQGNYSKFRHGHEKLVFPNGLAPGTEPTLELTDETYWNLRGTLDPARVIAAAEEDGAMQPQIWGLPHGKGRVFVCIPGHFAWTFDDPLYRAVLLRGICWAAQRPPGDLSALSTVGARMAP